MTVARLARLAVSIACIVVVLASGARAAGPAVQYELALLSPNTHWLGVTMRLTDLRGGTVSVAMPAWAPGAYMILEFAKNVAGFEAVTADGRPLAWHRTDKQTWQIETGGARTVVLKYRVYANNLGIIASDYTDQHAWVNGTSVFMYLVGGLAQPVSLRIGERPRGWHIATTLEAAGDGEYHAADYHTLVDSPILVSDFKELTFLAGGKPHHIVVEGEGKYDGARLVSDFRTIADYQAYLMGGLPFNEYIFFLILGKGLRNGGLEHAAGCALAADPDSFRDDAAYKRFIATVAHEYFHLWNVKRLRPAPLVPYDYSHEQYTTDLWFAEGVTTYYATLTTVRTGLQTPEQFYASYASLIKALDDDPAARSVPVAEQSWNTWLHPEWPNGRYYYYGYYPQGQLDGFLLDLELRGRTANRVSLDAVVRDLNARYAQRGLGYPEGAIRASCERLAGSDFGDFFRRYIYGTDKPDYARLLAAAGLLLQVSPGPVTATLNATTSADAGWVTVTDLEAGGAAAQAGVSVGDILLAMDGRRLTVTALQRVSETRKPGDRVELTITRGERLLTIPVTLGAEETTEYGITEAPDPTPVQASVRDALVGRGARPLPTALHNARETRLRNILQLTRDGLYAESYFAPDGQRLIFQATRAQYHCDQIFSINLDGTDMRLRSTGAGRCTCGYFLRDGRYLFSSTHLAGPECPPVPDRSRGYVWPVYSAYDIFAVDSKTGVTQRLTDNPGYDAETTESVDGSRLVFTSNRNGDLDLYTMRPDGSDVRRVTTRRGYDGGAFFSPDGRQLVFRSYLPKTAAEEAEYREMLAKDLVLPRHTEIYLCNADGSNMRQLTDNGALNFAPYFTPDGKQILFSSNLKNPNSFNFDLFLINLDGSGLEQITFDEGFDSFPMFSPDGKYLVWTSSRMAPAGKREFHLLLAEWGKD